MNREYANISHCSSDNGIYEAFYTEIGKPHTSVLFGARSRIVTVLRAILAFLSASRARRVARVGFVTVALVGMVGVAGALEAGNISPLVCLALCAGLLLLIYLAVRPTSQKKRNG